MVVKREPNEVVIRRFYDELWNEWRLAVADEILTPDVRFRGSLGGSSVGIEAFKDYFHQARTAFPDLHAQIDDLIVTGEVVVTRLTNLERHPRWRDLWHSGDRPPVELRRRRDLTEAPSAKTKMPT